MRSVEEERVILLMGCFRSFGSRRILNLVSVNMFCRRRLDIEIES